MNNFSGFKIFPLIIFLLFILPLLGKKGWPVILIIGGIYLLSNIFKKINLSGFANRSRAKNIMDTENVINMKPDFKFNPKTFKKKGLTVLAVIVVLFLLFTIIRVVPAGTTGVYHLFGKVSEQERSSGLHLKNPFAYITVMSIRTEGYTMSGTIDEGQKKGADAIMALTKEGLEVGLDITVLYHLKQEAASEVYKNVGLNYVEKIIRPAIKSGIREVVANYEAKDIYSEKRAEAANQILEKLKTEIEPRGIIMEEVLLRNVNLPLRLSDAIQEKLAAEQEAQRYDFVLQREEKEAERKRIEAQGQRDSQLIINQSLTQNYLNYLYIKELKDREGTIYVPTNPNTGVPLFRGL